MEWPKAQLVDLCEVFTDGDWIESKSQSPEGVRLIQTGNVGEGNFKDRRDKSRFISEETFDELKCCEIFEGDCLVSRLPDPVGRSCILPKSEDRMITAVDCTILRFKKDKLIPKFFNYFSQSSLYLNRVESLTSGATRKRISRKNLGLIDIPSPPIPEQKRIVAILDQAFADIEQARAKTEQNLKNARELFESYLQQVFSQRGKKVQSVELGDVVDVLTDYHANGSYKVLKQHVELKEQEDFAWMVRSTDFEKKFKNEKRYITEHAYNYLTKSKLFGGEIIMSKIGNAGKVYFMPETDQPCSLAMNLFLIRLDPSKANNEYIYRYLNSSSGKAQIAPRLKGAATQTITKDNVRSLQIPMPSLDGQHGVIKNLKILEKEIESLESLYMKKLTNIEELKKSILQKAFSGKLTKTLEVDTNKGAVA